MARKKQITVEQIDERITRWQGKLKRAVNTIERLQRMRKRALKKAAAVDLAIAPPLAKAVKPKPEPLAVTLFKEMAAEGAAESAERPAAPGVQAPAAIDTTLPDFLRRDRDTPEAAQIRAEQAERKSRKNAGRIATMKAKARGDLKKMPLTGRAAMAAIRG